MLQPRLLLALLALPTSIFAIPPRYEPLLFELEKRDCPVACGYQDKWCCNYGSVCYTDAATLAQCAASTAYQAMTLGGSYNILTTTYVQTDLVTRTSVITLWNAPAAASVYIAQSTAICYNPMDSCGALCCTAGEYCHAKGNCRPKTSTAYVPGGALTTPYSAPLRPTSAATTTTTIPVTETRPFITPVGTAGGTYGITALNTSSGLSGGAIAGIVIGVIAGIILLILICFCCILKAGFDGLLAIFGLGKNRRRERTEVVEERYTRYRDRPGSGVAASASRREQHGGWFGGGKRPVLIEEKRRSDHKEAGVLGGLAVGLAGLWAILGLKRREQRKAARSEVSYSSYTDSYTETSASSASSDQRTRRSRASRRP